MASANAEAIYFALNSRPACLIEFCPNLGQESLANARRGLHPVRSLRLGDRVTTHSRHWLVRCCNHSCLHLVLITLRPATGTTKGATWAPFQSY